MMDSKLELLDVSLEDVVATIGRWSIGDFYEWVGRSVVDGKRYPYPSTLNHLTPLQERAAKELYKKATDQFPEERLTKGWRNLFKR